MIETDHQTIETMLREPGEAAEARRYVNEAGKKYGGKVRFVIGWYAASPTVRSWHLVHQFDNRRDAERIEREGFNLARMRAILDQLLPPEPEVQLPHRPGGQRGRKKGGGKWDWSTPEGRKAYQRGYRQTPTQKAYQREYQRARRAQKRAGDHSADTGNMVLGTPPRSPKEVQG